MCLYEVQVFSVDARHLKDDWNGIMVTLPLKNAGNNIIHVATALCQKENADFYNDTCVQKQITRSIQFILNYIINLASYSLQACCTDVHSLAHSLRIDTTLHCRLVLRSDYKLWVLFTGFLNNTTAFTFPSDTSKTNSGWAYYNGLSFLSSQK